MEPYHFVEITCPDTGRPITVRRTLDPVGQLYVTNQISQHQRAAADAYQADVEALSGNMRALSRGVEDISWRSRRPHSDSKATRRLQRAGAALAPHQIDLLQLALAGRKVDTRKLGEALNVLAVVYGFSTPTRH